MSSEGKYILIFVLIGCCCSFFPQSQAGTVSLQFRLHAPHASPLGSGHILPPAVRLRRPTSLHLYPSFYFILLFPPSPYYPLFSLAWERGRAMTEVSAQVTVILCYRSVPTGRESMHSSSFSVLHQSALCALSIHIPAHQELPLSSLTGVRLRGL